MKQIMILLFISIFINACVKLPDEFFLYKGKIISTIDSLPKANTRFKIWEGKENNQGSTSYEESYFSTDGKGEFSFWRNKQISVLVSREFETSNNSPIFFTSSPSILIKDTLFFKDIYYKPW